MIHLRLNIIYFEDLLDPTSGTVADISVVTEVRDMVGYQTRARNQTASGERGKRVPDWSDTLWWENVSGDISLLENFSGDISLRAAEAVGA